MPIYNYYLAGINIRLETPFMIQITEESKNFFNEKIVPEDYTISFSKTGALPDIPQNGIWLEDAYYTTTERHKATFYRNVSKQPPYALFLEKENSLQCNYLKEKENIFTESRGILNHIGLEAILLKKNSFLLHASFVRCNGRGILFSGPCGAGKSTQAELWMNYMNAEILNGDRAAIRKTENGWKVYGMPFAGTSKIYRNESAPLSAIVTLGQSEHNSIKKLSAREAIAKLLPECSCRRWDRDFMNELLDLLLKLVQEVPVYLLECRPDESAVKLLYNTLKKDGRL